MSPMSSTRTTDPTTGPPGHRRMPRALAVTVVLVGIAALAGILALGAWNLGRPAAPRQPIAAAWGVTGALRGRDIGGGGGAGGGSGVNDVGEAAGGFARALAPRAFIFPADHGPHPDFRTEWWYYTGNLSSRDGRRFGFQLTFFRVGLAPAGAPPRASAWATRQVYFAHLAVTDVAGRRFHAYERWERGAVGLAGARAAPFRVWVGNWSATAAAPAAAATPPMRLTARAGHHANNADEADKADGALDEHGADGAPDSDIALDLVLAGTLPPVLQGDHGLSPKSAEPGNASYYYSLPRLAATGTLHLAGVDVAVAGSAWMDREWSTSALAPEEVGWDWFALQLDDGWELMLYRLRRRTGTAADPAVLADPASRATLIAPDGRTQVLPPGAWTLAETAAWTSPASGTRYPAAWRLSLPAAGGPPLLDLAVRPVLPNQELALSFRYWEGAVDARGTHAGQPVAGRGYVELTGYGDAPRSP
jgi:predicted secreted hydrolase